MSPFTANGWDVSVMKLKVKGLSSGVSKIIINYKPLPFSAFVSLAADQSENIISPFGRMLIKKQELSGGSVSPPATSYSGKAQSNPLEKQSQSTSKSTNCVVNGPAVDLSLNEFPTIATVRLGPQKSPNERKLSQSTSSDPVKASTQIVQQTASSSATSSFRKLSEDEILVNGVILDKGLQLEQDLLLGSRSTTHQLDSGSQVSPTNSDLKLAVECRGLE